MVTLISGCPVHQSHHSLSDTIALRCSLSVCILCVSLSELLLGVVAPRSGSCSVCILCVSLSELLLGVVAPRSGSFSVCILCVCLSELLLGVVAPPSGSFRASIHVCHVFVVVHVPYYSMSYHKQSLIQYKRYKRYWIVH